MDGQQINLQIYLKFLYKTFYTINYHLTKEIPITFFLYLVISFIIIQIPSSKEDRYSLKMALTIDPS